MMILQYGFKVFISLIFKDKHITPITFRRIVPSIIFSEDLHEPGKNVEQFFGSYGHVVNTSYKVL